MHGCFIYKETQDVEYRKRKGIGNGAFFVLPGSHRKGMHMNTAIILAAGVGQRMRNGGLPKQFLKLLGKPIIVYTLEKFEECEAIDQIVIVCHGGYIDHMTDLVKLYHLQKVKHIVVGGTDRQSSIEKGLDAIAESVYQNDDIVVIHDGVRPLIMVSTIEENIRKAKQYGCAITVRPVTESVVITDQEEVEIGDFKQRDNTYSMTSPQTFRLEAIIDAYKNKVEEHDGMPLLDAAMIYAKLGGQVVLVKEHNSNIKITTPEDFYFLKAILELEENKYIFGL